jgi:hypothetical protein
MRRLAVLLYIAVMLATTAAGAQARPQPYAGTSPPQPHHAAAPTAGPTWTAAIVGGIAVMLVCGAVGVAAGRASARPQVRVPRHA